MTSIVSKSSSYFFAFTVNREFHCYIFVSLFRTFRFSASEDFGLDLIGVELDDRGMVKVDHQGRTSIPHIFAIGDIQIQTQFTVCIWTTSNSYKQVLSSYFFAFTVNREGMDTVLPGFDKDMTSIVSKSMKKTGIEIFTGANPDPVHRLYLDDVQQLQAGTQQLLLCFHR
jgi:hypothetical protein